MRWIGRLVQGYGALRLRSSWRRSRLQARQLHDVCKDRFAQNLLHMPQVQACRIYCCSAGFDANLLSGFVADLDSVTMGSWLLPIPVLARQLINLCWPERQITC